MEPIIERRRVTAHKIGIGVVDEHTVSVADHAVGHEKPAVGDGPTIVLAANPTEHAVVVARAPAWRRDSSIQCEQAGLISVSNIWGRNSDFGSLPSSRTGGQCREHHTESKHRETSFVRENVQKGMSPPPFNALSPLAPLGAPRIDRYDRGRAPIPRPTG